MSGSLAGLAILWSQNFVISLGFQVNMSTESEAYLSSVERMNYYATYLEHEAPLHLPTDDQVIAEHATRKGTAVVDGNSNDLPEWPSEGVLEFRNVVLRYRPELEPALTVSHDLGMPFSLPSLLTLRGPPHAMSRPGCDAFIRG